MADVRDVRDVWTVEGLRLRSGEPVVRLVIYERDPDTGARSVKDIAEWDLGTWTPSQIGRQMVQRCLCGGWEEDVDLQPPEGLKISPRVKRLASRLTKIVEFRRDSLLS